MTLFSAIIIILIQYTHCIIHHTILNVTHERTSGIAIFQNYQNVNTSNNVWHIDPASQEGFDLLLVMENQWTFDSFIESEITLKIDGFTPTVTRIDGEFMIVFSVGNREYFNVVIRLDEGRNTWKYYPALKDINNYTFALNNAVYENIISAHLSNGTDTRNRWDRLSNRWDPMEDQWTDIIPYYKEPLQWPLIIKLFNDPIADTLLYQCILNDSILEVEYEKAFNGSQRIDVYILNDANDDKPFDIYSIEVEYRDDINLTDTISTTEITDSFNTTELDISSSMETSTASTTSTTSTSESVTTRISTSTSMESTDDDLIKEGDDGDDGMSKGEEIGLIIGIVLACLCVFGLIVFGVWYYRKREKKLSDPSGVNKGEYHTPVVEVTEIDQVLEHKRKESIQYAEENGKRRRISTGQRRKDGVIPIKSEEPDESDESDDETQEW